MIRVIATLFAALILMACEPRTLPPLIEFERTADNPVERGKRLATVLGCRGCHGDDLRGKDWSDPDFGTLWTANLSRSVPRLSDEQLRQAIAGGSNPERPLWDMPSHLFTRLSGGDWNALVAYLRSVPQGGDVHPPPSFTAEVRKEIASGAYPDARQLVLAEGKAWPPDAGPDHRLGQYIARATCAECHGMNLAGGTPYPGAAPRPDLRMVAGYDLQAFRALLRTGKAAGGREVGLMSEVARGRYRHFTDSEVRALHAYLQAVAAKPS
nr:c-type cytochrome [uncultured Sphingomonas sp.]